MTKYRKKPVVIEAIQFEDTSDILAKLSDFIGKDIKVSYCERIPSLEIETLEGTMKALPGDYIIKGVKGEFYPCKPDIFEQTYDAVGARCLEMNVSVKDTDIFKAVSESLAYFLDQADEAQTRKVEKIFAKYNIQMHEGINEGNC